MGVLFATDRQPATKEGSFYQDGTRGYSAVGVGKLTMGDGDYTWEEEEYSPSQTDRSEDFPLQVTSVEEYGFLEESYTPFLDPASVPEDRTIGGKRFSEAVNGKLATSRNKDVYIYVHGFKTVFENPLLVAAELWHYLGYDGVFIGYSWPATPSIFAYGSDIETAQVSARNLKLFLTFLARETDARPHPRSGIQRRDQGGYRGPEPTRHATQHGGTPPGPCDHHGQRLRPTTLRNPPPGWPSGRSESLTIYESAGDQALGMSNRVFGRNRLGQVVEGGPP